MSDGPDLFGARKAKPARRQAPPTDPGAVQRLIMLYKALYEARLHEPPVVQKRDGALLKALVATYGEPKVEARLRAFMAWGDRFVEESGYSLALLQSQWNRLAAQVLLQAPDPQRVPNADATAAYLRSLKGGR